MYPEVFLTDRYTTQPMKALPWLAPSGEFVPPDNLKMHSLAMSVLRFLCKTIFKLLKLSLQNSPFYR